MKKRGKQLVKRLKVRKEHIATYLFIGIIVGIALGGLYFLNVSMTGFAVYEQGSQSEFDEGTYDNTEYNGSAVILSSGQTSGNYTSKIFNAGGDAIWNSLTWTATDFGELSDNGQGSLMSGNVLLMHMNEASGTIEDTSGGNNDGTYNGALYSQSGKLNNAIGFDGSDDYINVSDSATLSVVGDITLGAWIKPNNVVGYKNIIVKEAGANQLSYGLTTSPSDIYFWFYANSSYKIHETTSNFLDVGQWWNIVAVYDDVNNNIILYANGVEKYNSAETSSLVDYANSPLNIGWRNTKLANQQFDGSIDEVAIWNRTLSSNEVSEIYKRGALKLNLTARTCDDDLCSGEIWTDIIEFSPQDLSLSNNQYFQYKFLFETDDNSYSPELESVSIDYSALDSSPPQISFSSSTTETGNYNQDWINVGVDVSDDSQIYSFINFNKSIVGFWKMNDTGATIKDYSGYGNDGTNNGASSTRGKFGNALDFDGVSNKISCGTSQLFNFDKDDAYTLSAWIKTTDSSHPILGKMTTNPYPGYDLNVWNNKLRAHLVSSWSGNKIIVDSTSLINDGTWTYVAATYDGSSSASGMKVYVNGQEESNIVEDTLTGQTINGANFEIGTRTAGGFLEGTIDEVLIFNRVLSTDEISALYNASSYSHNFTELSDGSYNFYAYAQDSLGNENQTETQTVNLVSNVAPTIELVEPQNTLYLSNESLALDFSVSDTDGNLDSCWYSLDSGENVSLIGCQNTTFNVSGDGVYVLNIYANDSEGLEVSDSVSFNIDVTGISLSISQPTGTKSSRTSIPITFTAIGNNLTCWYNVKTSIGGGVIENTTLADCNDSGFDVSADGDYVLNLHVNNTLGSSDSDSSSFSVSTGATVVVNSGGGGGGSSRTTIITPNGTTQLTIEGIQDLVVNPKDVKQVSWFVKNTGTNFLNDCKLKGEEGYVSWVFSEEVKSLAAGEKYGFVFDVVVPETAESGKYTLTISLTCAEISEFSCFVVEILEKKLGFDLIKVSRVGEDHIKIIYLIEELSGLEQEVEMQFLLFDSNDEKAVEVKENRLVTANSQQEFEILIPVDSSLEGELGLLVNLNSETYSTFIQENIILGSPISGFAVFGKEGFDNAISLIFILLFLVFAFFMVKGILKHRKKK